MPRLRDPDEEDPQVNCPRCKGSGRVYRVDINDDGDCPLCHGEGTVSPAVYRRYLRGATPEPTTDG